jgi:hypothetical protein
MAEKMNAGAAPRAGEVFVNWLLTKERREVFGKAMGQGTGRLDADTRWLKEFGVTVSKDGMTVEQYYNWENQSEDRILSVRRPAAALAHRLLD